MGVALDGELIYILEVGYPDGSGFIGPRVVSLNPEGELLTRVDLSGPR